MSRGHLRERLVSNTTGLPLANATVTVREVGTTDALAATMYDALSSGNVVANPITTGADGVVEFYLDTPQDVDLRVVAAGYPDATISSVKAHYDQGDLASKSGAQTLDEKTLTNAVLTAPEITSPTITSGQTLLPDGTLSAPSQSFSADTDTGRRRVSADYMEDVVGAQSAIRMKKGTKFSQIGIGNVDEPGPGGDANIVHVHYSNSSGSFGDIVGLAVEVTNEASSGGAGTIPDSSSISAYHYATAATANLSSRAGEFQVIVGHASANAHANATTQAIEAAIHTKAAGDGTRKTGVIHLGSYDASGFSGCVAADYAMRIWGARGFIRGIIQEDTSGNLIFYTDGSDGSITTAGHLSMTGAGKRFIVDGNHATIANRAFFQTKNSNQPTYIGTVPNGSSLVSGVMVANEQGLVNFSYGLLEISNGQLILNSTKGGSGTAHPLRLQYDGTTRIEMNGTGIGVFGATPAARRTAMVLTYSTEDRTLSAYTPDTESVAYTGVNNAQVGNVYPLLTDLNALRTAYENLRAFTEDLAQAFVYHINNEKLIGWEA
jgi:hypothetical protein